MTENIDSVAMEETASQSFLLRIERVFYRHKRKLLWVHSAMFIAFAVLLFVPLFFSFPVEGDNIFNHFALFANYIMWGVWFPLVMLSTLFVGRGWCGLLCPMGAASQMASRHGFKRAVPRWLKWEGTPIVAFLLVTIWGQTIGVRDYADSMAIVFGSLMLVAIAFGFLFTHNKRPWCRHACPIGLLLGIFSRLGMVHFMPKNKKIFSQRYNAKGLCPTMIKLSCKDESRHCIECFGCVRPDTNSGLELKTRYMGEEVEYIARHNPNRSEIWMLLLTAGITLGGFLWLSHPLYQQWRRQVGEWLLQQKWFGAFEAGPAWLMSVHPEQREVFSWLDFSMIVSFMLGCMVLIAVSLAGFIALSAWMIRDKDYDFKHDFMILAYQYTPVVLVSILLGLGGELFALFEILGFEASTISIIKVSLLILAVGWSVRIGVKILYQRHVRGRDAVLPLGVSALGSIFIGTLWCSAMGLF